jgi:hypothetical protein
MSPSPPAALLEAIVSLAGAPDPTIMVGVTSSCWFPSTIALGASLKTNVCDSREIPEALFDRALFGGAIFRGVELSFRHVLAICGGRLTNSEYRVSCLSSKTF